MNLTNDPEHDADADGPSGGEDGGWGGEDTGANHLVENEENGTGDAYLAVVVEGKLLLKFAGLGI